jgi:hypothetical protein
MHAHHDSEFVTQADATRFPATSTTAEGDHGHLNFPSFQEDHKKWPKWLAQIGNITLSNPITVQNADQHQEQLTYYALFVFGQY